ncbi:MAG: hypothetical protein ACRDHZ_11835 [Ktedonobacteraceae bacterium]
MDFEHGYRATRQAWIDGVTTFYPGPPKASYITPWDEMAEWEQAAVKKLFTHVRAIILPGLKDGIQLSRAHGGYLVCSIWNALMFELLRDPKPSYVKHFDQLDEWQQKTDGKMFEAIEAAALQELSETH